MKKIFFLVLFIVGAPSLQAQDDVQPVSVEIQTKRGEKLKGKIIQIKRDTAHFQDESGNMQRIAMSDIRNIDYVDAQKSRGRNWFANPNTLRYYFSSTAIPVEKHRLQLGSTYGFVTTAHYGLTDRISIGGGADLFGGNVAFLNAKVNIVSSAHHKLSAGVHYYRMPEDFIETYSGEDVRDLAMITAASTWGNENANFTLGAGYMYIMGGFIPPLVTVGGMARVLERFSIVTENWFFFVGEQTGVPVVISLGIRYLSKRSSIDVGLFTDHESRFGSVVPYIAYSIKLGKIDD